MKCYCGVTEKQLEHCTYVVSGVPCCTKNCWKAAVTKYLRETDKVTHISTGEKPDHSWDVVA